MSDHRDENCLFELYYVDMARLVISNKGNKRRTQFGIGPIPKKRKEKNETAEQREEPLR